MCQCSPWSAIVLLGLFSYKWVWFDDEPEPWFFFHALINLILFQSPGVHLVLSVGNPFANVVSSGVGFVLSVCFTYSSTASSSEVKPGRSLKADGFWKSRLAFIITCCRRFNLAFFDVCFSTPLDCYISHSFPPLQVWPYQCISHQSTSLHFLEGL